MAFTSTILNKYVFGNRRVHSGTWTSGTPSTGGAIETGLKRIEIAKAWHKGAAVEADVAVINDTFPKAASTFTIVCTADDEGYWEATGLAKS